MLLLVFVDGCTAFSFEIPPKKEKCFYEVVEKDQQLGMMFQVTAGGFLDIDVNVLDPQRKAIYTGTKEKDGRYSFSAESAGTYSFCFGNLMSTVTSKQVQLVITVGKPEYFSEVADEDSVSPLLDVIIQLEDAINSIGGDLDYLKMRESAHRSTNESTNERVVYWSIFEMIILVALSSWQVYYLKRFFEDRRSL
uniref:GOLD domain-containing protein n=1 Tax=Arcella intermedia TaxID=1963864 RepID=A0A6B2LJV9_9EUKA